MELFIKKMCRSKEVWKIKYTSVHLQTNINNRTIFIVMIWQAIYLFELSSYQSSWSPLLKSILPTLGSHPLSYGKIQIPPLLGFSGMFDPPIKEGRITQIFFVFTKFTHWEEKKDFTHSRRPMGASSPNYYLNNYLNLFPLPRKETRSYLHLFQNFSPDIYFWGRGAHFECKSVDSNSADGDEESENLSPGQILWDLIIK